MRKFSKIISVICVLAFVLSFTAFAAIEDGMEVEYALKSDKASYTVGDEVSVTLYADGMSGAETFGVLWATMLYDTKLEFVSDTLGNAEASVQGDGTGALTFEIEDEEFTTNWESLVTVKFNALEAGEYTVCFDDLTFADMEYNEVYCDALPSITITVKEAGSVGPVSVATTMTIGEKEYTSVPNALVENVNFTDGVITGALNIDYWKNGAAQPAIVIEAAKFVGMPANVTGTGTASFTVALMGVPENVVVTGISFK